LVLAINKVLRVDIAVRDEVARELGDADDLLDDCC